MLTLVITPGGTRRVVTIAEALYHLGHDMHGRGISPERTEEEKRLHRAALRREYQRRMQERQQEPEQ